MRSRQAELFDEILKTRLFDDVMDGWMTCDFSSFSTVLQSYQANERMIMAGFVQWNPVYRQKDCTLSRSGSWDR